MSHEGGGAQIPSQLSMLKAAFSTAFLSLVLFANSCLTHRQFFTVGHNHQLPPVDSVSKDNRA